MAKRRRTIKDVRGNGDEGGSGLPPVSPMPKFEAKDRITVVSTFNYEHRGDQPYSTQNIFIKTLDSNHEPYSRRVQVNGDWVPLDLGWVPTKDVGAIIIDNLEGIVTTPTQPSEEERENSKKRIVEVSYAKDSKKADLIYPKGSVQKFPSDAGSLFLRCQHGTASCRVHIFSK
jgi:hypothetical protein